MTFDLVIRGGRVVDGTGMPAFTADVGVRDGRIAAHRPHRASGARARSTPTGCWSRPASSTCTRTTTCSSTGIRSRRRRRWHGVDDGARPATAASRSRRRSPRTSTGSPAMLSRVEGMSRAALREGLRFRGGSFADYWRRFDGRLGVNVGSYVGHCAVRRFVMGDAASERARRPPPRSPRCRSWCAQAMREGAIGFSTSQLDIHVGEDGREVPSQPRRAARRSSRCARCWRSSSAARSRSSRAASRGLRRRRPRADARDVPRLGPADRAERAGADAATTRWAGSARSSSCARPSRRACACTRSSPPTSSGST